MQFVLLQARRQVGRWVYGLEYAEVVALLVQFIAINVKYVRAEAHVSDSIIGVSGCNLRYQN